MARQSLWVETIVSDNKSDSDIKSDREIKSDIKCTVTTKVSVTSKVMLTPKLSVTSKVTGSLLCFYNKFTYHKLYVIILHQI